MNGLPPTSATKAIQHIHRILPTHGRHDRHAALLVLEENMLPMQNDTEAPSANARPSAVCCARASWRSGPNRSAPATRALHRAEPQVERPAPSKAASNVLITDRQRENYREQADVR